MPIAPIPEVTLTPVAYFPQGYFLENLAVRSDGSVLISSLLHKELWCVPGSCNPPSGEMAAMTSMADSLRSDGPVSSDRYSKMKGGKD